jgi:hypothetical protein
MKEDMKNATPLLIAFGVLCLLWSVIRVVQAAPLTVQPDVTRKASRGTLLIGHGTSAEKPLACEPVAEVEVRGPETGATGFGYAFIGVVSPVTASMPITYIWRADDQALVEPREGGVEDTIEFTWEVTGVKSVTLTVSDTCGTTQSDSHDILIEPSKRQHLPFVARNIFKDPYEPNDTFDEAHGPLVPGQAYFSYIPDDTDPSDFYYVVSAATAPLRVWLTVPSALDLDLYVYNEARELVSWSNVSGKGINEALRFTPAVAGTYFIRVYPYDGWSMSSPYTLVATFHVGQ